MRAISTDWVAATSLHHVVHEGVRALPEAARHLQRTLVVGDHPREEEPVELLTVGREELRHLLAGDHAAHLVAVVGVGIGRRQAVVGEPGLHDLDLGPLPGGDAVGHGPDARSRARSGASSAISSACACGAPSR
jgi:hypothetical protein